MTRSWLTASLCLLAFLPGCSNAELEALRAQLEECKTDKVAAQEASSACEARYEREVRQWESMETVVEEVLPQTLRDFRSERDQIIELVPQQTRQEVERYLDEFSDAVAKGFQVMQENNELIIAQLETAKLKLDRVDLRTSSIDETVGETLQEAFATRDDLIANRNHMMRQATAIVDEIHDFDRLYVNEKSSSQRLRLNRRQRETLKLFHDSLVGKLAALGNAPKPSEVP